METIKEIRKNRLEKIDKIVKIQGTAYPEVTKRTHQIKEALASFSSLSKTKKEIILAGRMKSLRGHGGSTFLDIEDGTGKIQAFLRKDRVGEKKYDLFIDTFDIGDFIELRGTFFVTKKGQKTLEVADYKLLAKSLLPLPEKWHGLKDAEERFRKRYLDLIFNPEVREKFILRSKIVKEIRSFLEGEGFLEVETPILQPLYGGAKAKPFKTHLNALDMDLYLRIAPELYLKRLLVGGFEKVFEVAKCFRNEGVDKSHNPDFTMLEFYWAYADYKELMKLTERMFESLLKKIFKKLEIGREGKKLDFKTPWPRIEFNQLFKKYTKINIEEINLEALKKEAKKLGVVIDKTMKKPEITDEIYKKYCLPKIWNPTFVINYPVGSTYLAKEMENNNKKLAMFQLVIAGWEIVKAYSELNDPIKQKENFAEQERLPKEGVQEVQRIDNDYIEALEYGMPPAAGFGMGIDRLVVLLTDSHSLREVILFPTMRNKE
ncbi:MAG: lysine--tRNA ligase [bacterium]